MRGLVWLVCVTVGCVDTTEDGQRDVGDTDGESAGKASAGDTEAAGSSSGVDDPSGPASDSSGSDSEPGSDSASESTTGPDTTDTAPEDTDSGAAETSTGGSTDPTTPGSASSGDPDGLSFAAEVFPLLDGRCEDGNCHQNGGGAAGLNLDEDNAYYNLLAYQSIQAPGVDIVEPGDVDGSYLHHKLVGTHKTVGGYGDTMPIGAPALPAADIAIIDQWIEEGAAP